MPVYIWSQTASANATADSTINWSEGQAPSTVNDSARAEMAAVAKYRDDNNGSLVTGGTSTAYTLATASGFDTLAHLDGQTLAFKVHTTSGASPTLNVDGLGAKAINHSTGVNVATSALVSGSTYTVTFRNATNEFILDGQVAAVPGNQTVGGTLTVSGTATFNGTENAANQVTFTGVISPGALGSSTNDWAPANLSSASVLRVTASSAVNLTGLTGGTDGRLVFLDNIGSSNITLTAQDASSAAANRFLMPRPLVLRPNTSVALKYDGTSTGWRVQSVTVPNPVAAGFKNLMVGNVAGPNGFTAPTTPNNQVKITADAVTLEDANGESWRATSVSVTADVTVSGANGLDTGSVAASTWYSVWVIYNPTTNAVAALLSTSATAPAMPSGYTFKARVSWNRTNASSQFNRVLQQGRRAQYVVVASSPTALLPNISNGTAGTYSSTTPTYTTASVANVVPTTASEIFVVIVQNWKNGSQASIQVAPNAAYSGQQDSNGNVPAFGSSNSATFQETRTLTVALEGATIAWTSSAAGGAISCLGWVDNI